MTPPPLTFNAWLRWDLIVRWLENLGPIENVLEIGPGEGAVGWRLAQRFSYTGVEMDPVSFATASARLSEIGTLLHGDHSAIPAGKAFDLVCAFEVLEHLENDRAGLGEWRGLIRPGGWILLSVPAGPERYGAWDRLVGHYRRYERRGLQRLLEEVGFKNVEIAAYGFPLGYLLEEVRNVLARSRETDKSARDRTRASGRVLQPRDWMAHGTYLISLPFRLLQRPFSQTLLGTGFVARGRVPN